MSTFEILLIILLVCYFIFNIFGFIISNKHWKEDHDITQQVKVLTNRLGEIATENERLNNLIRDWQNSAMHYKTLYETSLNIPNTEIKLDDKVG